MGIDSLKKTYVLSHTRKFNRKTECLYRHQCAKLIGIFDSKDRALNVLKSYKNLEGFKKHPRGFRIQKYQIDSIADTKISQLLESKKRGKYSEVK